MRTTLKTCPLFVALVVGLAIDLAAGEACSDDGQALAAVEPGMQQQRLPKASDPVDELDLENRPSLESVQRYAVQHNPAIKTADYNWQAAQQRITQARSYKNPMITYVPDTGSNSQTRAGQVGNTVVLSQALPFPGKLTLKGRIAREQANAAHQGVEAAVDDVSSRARRGYADYYFAFRSLDTNAETMELVREFLALAQTKYRVGRAAQQDVILAQERLSRLATERVVFEGSREQSLGALNAVLNRAPRAPVGKPTTLSARELAVPLKDFVDSAEASRPELRAQKYIVDARRRAVTLAKMGYLPDFEVGAQHSSVAGGTNPSFANDGDDIWTARLGLSIPLWTSRIGAEVAEAEAQLMQEQSKYRDLRNAVFDQVQASYERVRIAARNEAIYRTTLIPQTRERIAAARAGYETGRVDFLTLIDSLNSLEEILLKRYRSVRDYHQAIADVERAVGRPISEVH